MTDEPQSPADPRPNGEPYYIDSECQGCGTELVLADRLDDETRRGTETLADPEHTPDEVWHDEWICPNCLDGIRLDVPDDYMASIDDAIQDVTDRNFASKADLAEALQAEPDE